MTDAELEEERRMFYVAMTRAKQHLFIFIFKKKRQEISCPRVFLMSLADLLFFLLTKLGDLFFELKRLVL